MPEYVLTISGDDDEDRSDPVLKAPDGKVQMGHSSTASGSGRGSAILAFAFVRCFLGMSVDVTVLAVLL